MSNSRSSLHRANYEYVKGRYAHERTRLPVGYRRRASPLLALVLLVVFVAISGFVVAVILPGHAVDMLVFTAALEVLILLGVGVGYASNK